MLKWFGLKLVSLNELALLRRMIDEAVKENERHREEIKRLNLRAEEAINVMLRKTVGVGIEPQVPASPEDIDGILARQMSIFGEEEDHVASEKQVAQDQEQLDQIQGK